MGEMPCRPSDIGYAFGMEIIISNDAKEMGQQAALRGAAALRQAIAERGSANVIVATGASQFTMLEALVMEDVDWTKVTGFHLDEYLQLPATHPASFRKYLKERFVDRLPLAAFHYVQGDAADPQAECERLGRLIEKFPIDVAFIGIGENGHLAFNDPPADFETTSPYLVVKLDEACRRQQMGEGWFPTLEDVPQRAISMSVRQILKSRLIVCSVPDARKAAAVKGAVNGPVTPTCPASILQQHPNCGLFLDKASASEIQA
jgi:glucosamine-6-phosphate deaminase